MEVVLKNLDNKYRYRLKTFFSQQINFSKNNQNKY